LYLTGHSYVETEEVRRFALRISVIHFAACMRAKVQKMNQKEARRNTDVFDLELFDRLPAAVLLTIADRH
jgi:hypothetical protein